MAWQFPEWTCQKITPPVNRCAILYGQVFGACLVGKRCDSVSHRGDEIVCGDMVSVPRMHPFAGLEITYPEYNHVFVVQPVIQHHIAEIVKNSQQAVRQAISGRVSLVGSDHATLLADHFAIGNLRCGRQVDFSRAGKQAQPKQTGPHEQRV